MQPAPADPTERRKMGDSKLLNAGPSSSGPGPTDTAIALVKDNIKASTIRNQSAARSIDGWIDEYCCRIATSADAPGPSKSLKTRTEVLVLEGETDYHYHETGV
jgi:hypothetical protein